MKWGGVVLSKVRLALIPCKIKWGSDVRVKKNCLKVSSMCCFLRNLPAVDIYYMGRTLILTQNCREELSRSGFTGKRVTVGRGKFEK